MNGLFQLSHRPRSAMVYELGPGTLDSAANLTAFEWSAPASRPIIEARGIIVCLEDDNGYAAGEEIPIEHALHNATSDMDGRPSWTLAWQGSTVKLVVFHNGTQLQQMNRTTGVPAAMSKTAWAFKILAHV